MAKILYLRYYKPQTVYFLNSTVLVQLGCFTNIWTKFGSTVLHISLQLKAGKANPRSNFGIYQFDSVTIAVVVSQLDRKMIVLTSCQILLKSLVYSNDFLVESKSTCV